MHRSALYVDDGDGQVSDQERNEGESATGGERRE
jgi:hypothetical protein